MPVLQRCARSFEVIFVDDGSTDNTLEVLRAAHLGDPRVRALSLSRNFGKEVAIAAGLDHAKGAATVIMDADLQHPPEAIEAFVALWRKGYKNVFGQRMDRAADSPLRRLLSQQFYRLFGSVGETSLPEGAGDFRLLDAQAVAALRTMREHARFSKGLYAWIGFKSIGAPFEVAQRAHGASKFSYLKLTNFALDGLMSFTTMPLKVWSYIGMATSFFALAMATFYLTRTIIFGVDVPGYASLIVSITFFAGVQLLSLGVIGEYIGRIFAEVKRRPLYFIEERIGLAPSAEAIRAPLATGPELSMLKSLISVGGFTLLSRFAGFLRDMVLGAVLGAGLVADAFVVAQRLPNHFRAIFGEGAFNSAYVPSYARVRQFEGLAGARIFSGQIFFGLLASQILVLALAWAFTPSFIDLLAPGFRSDPEKFALTVSLTRITFPYLLFITLVTLQSGTLNAHGYFAAAAFAPVLMNISMIFFLGVAFLFPNAGAAASWGLTFSGLLQLGLTSAAARRAGILERLTRPALTANVKHFLATLGPA